MTDTTQPAPRTFRFAPLDRSGWILGLGGAQCAAAGVGIVVAGALLEAGAPLPVVLTPIAAAAVYVFGSWDGRRLHEWAPVLARFATLRLRRRTTWFAELPLLTGTTALTDSSKDDGAVPVPPFLAGLSLLDAGPVPWSPLPGATAGVVADAPAGTVSVSLPVRGYGFSLLERAEQERLVQLWGDALGGFCRERSAVSGVRWTEWAAPAGATQQERFLDETAATTADARALASYRSLLAEAGPALTRHEVLVTVTVEVRRVRQRRGGLPAQDAAVEVLLEELRLLAARLDAAGLEVGPPLSPDATAMAIRGRLDPTGLDRHLRHPGHAGPGTPGPGLALGRAAPLATALEWGQLRVDGAAHRTYWVAEWPRLEMPPAWLEPVLLHAGGVRTVAVHFEPVAPSRSQRHVERDSTRLATDEEQRARSGFRIGARHRRAHSEVAAREQELVAGYAELEFTGFVTVSAGSDDELARSCAEYEQIAAQAGLDLRALEGRHDLAVVCTLPVGRGLAPRRQL